MPLGNKFKPNIWSIAIFGSALAFALILYGAVPFVALPTSGQAIWAMGFSQSFINHSLFSVYATNFGIPKPAPIAFGLSGAYPAGLFIAAGLHPADAYALMMALWITVAFAGAYRIGLRHGVHGTVSALLAALWISMPVVLRNEGFSMLSLGIALLPFYLWFALRLYTHEPEHRFGAVGVASFYILACLIAAFMDGYTFIMFAVGSTILAGYTLWQRIGARRYLLSFALPVHVIGFLIAYLLYTTYIGESHFPPDSLDTFRGQSIALSFILIPTQGIHWLWDALGLSVARSRTLLFGTAQAWGTTFSIPLIVSGITAWWLTRKKAPLATGFFLIALFGFYMALGPSLRIHPARPAAMIKAGKLGAGMPASAAIMPTGNAFLSRHLPGFKSMRYPCRWMALSLCGFWLLLVVSLGRLQKSPAKMWGAILVLALILSNLPHVIEKWDGDVAHRNTFIRLDADLLANGNNPFHEGEVVAFLPLRKYFLINYLASRTKIRTYDIGGDKNLWMARQHWPKTMLRFRYGKRYPNFVNKVLLLLASGDADAVALPYINAARAIHHWPSPPSRKPELQPIISELRASKYVNVSSGKYFAMVTIAPKYKDDVGEQSLKRLVVPDPCFVPECLALGGSDLAYVMSSTGRFKDGSKYSSGKTGYLVSGPYLHMNAGEYNLIVRGTATRAGSAWVDVMASPPSGWVHYGKFPLSRADSADDVLATGKVTLKNPADDLQVRVHVTAEDKVRLDGYRLQPVK